MADFPSLSFFEQLVARMASRPEDYRKMGPVDLTLVVRLLHPDGRAELYSLAFDGFECIASQPATLADVRTRHAVVIEGEFEHWREMIANIRQHGAADLSHTLNYLTLPDWPFRLVAIDDDEGQLDIDRFYRYQTNLQAFFDEAGELATRATAAVARESACAAR